MQSASAANLQFVVRTIAQVAVDNETQFCDLDAVVGDGDFGYSLARGFEIIIADWDTIDRTSPSAFLQQVAITISKRVGGTSGPIWGTAFLRAAIAVRDKQDLTSDDVVAILRSAAEGIKKRGNSDVGDKTLLDALVPMTDAIAMHLTADPTAAAAEIAEVASKAARAAADATSAMRATRGRASYTGDRSIGSPDAGAIAVAVMAEAVARNWPPRASL
ncbi:dihydroxyacetone kinase subunit DhaL [Nocardia pseudovaccinii]|uniref:dihydroxyacetone kinase subunit DhaL n=1 Tax=Nocardia pseudovaccinii TaxID=189540 RepID=UPI003D8F9EF5